MDHTFFRANRVDAYRDRFIAIANRFTDCSCASGTVSCQQSVSAAVSGKTLPDQIYIPNAFSPNGDGTNDVLLVYGYTITNIRFTVFNQWGEKIFESNNQSTGWNGTYKGKTQPSGVYMYVCQITLRDGTTQVKKGSINLVR